MKFLKSKALRKRFSRFQGFEKGLRRAFPEILWERISEYFIQGDPLKKVFRSWGNEWSILSFKELEIGKDLKSVEPPKFRPLSLEIQILYLERVTQPGPKNTCF